MGSHVAPLLGTGADLAADLRAWAHAPIWPTLVAAFGGDLRGGPQACLDRLAWLDAFSDRWDARHGHLERDEAGELALTVDQVEVVRGAADWLGMLGTREPASTDYDLVVVLGGHLPSCMIRPLHAARLLDSGTVRTHAVLGLGRHRRFLDEERRLAQAAGLVGVDDEFAALAAGVRAAFRLGPPVARRSAEEGSRCGRWTVDEHAPTHGVTVSVAGAPCPAPGTRRATTADAYRWMARSIVALRAGQRLLAVTTCAFVPAQHAVALLTLGLPYGVVVDTVGADPGEAPDPWRQALTPTSYLMEIRSAIRATHQVASAALGSTGQGGGTHPSTSSTS